jgi:hypothetical protein
VLRRPDRFVVIGVALVAAQLGLRGWALAGSWFYFDDLAFMSQALNGPMDAGFLFQSYGGHLSPGGMALTYLLTEVAAFTWWPWALVLLAMQALAGLGMLRLLTSLFGRHPLVLALLTGYLFYVFTLSAGIWWAAGINQLPMLVSLAFGLHAFVDHLRSRRVRPLVVALLWTVGGLLFYEKTVLLIGVYAIVALAYFCQGDTPARLRQLWSTYRVATVAFTVLGAGYLALYLAIGLEPATTTADTGTSWAHLAWNVVMVSLATAILGGPVTWDAVGAGSLADPTTVLQLAGWVSVVGAVVYATRTRTMGLRAWLPLAFTLTCTIVLLVGARASIVGPAIGLEYRYQPESGALFVIGVGLALLPLRGAPERNVERPDVLLVDRRPWVVPAVTAVVTVLAVISTVRYVTTWQDGNDTAAYVDNVSAALEGASEPVPLIDASIPQTLLWAYRYPENTYSHIFRPWADDMAFPGAAVDDLHLFDDTGHLGDVGVTPERSMRPTSGCGYEIGSAARTIPLDGPVLGGGWWVAANYEASEPVDLVVEVGLLTHHVDLPAGRHQMLFSAEGEFRSIRMRDDDAGADSEPGDLCVTSLILGVPQAVTTTR